MVDGAKFMAEYFAVLFSKAKMIFARTFGFKESTGKWLPPLIVHSQIIPSSDAVQ